MVTAVKNEKGGVDIQAIEEENDTNVEELVNNLLQAPVYEVFHGLKAPIPSLAYSNMEASCKVVSTDYQYACEQSRATTVYNFTYLCDLLQKYTMAQLLEMFTPEEVE